MSSSTGSQQRVLVTARLAAGGSPTGRAMLFIGGRAQTILPIPSDKSQGALANYTDAHYSSTLRPIGTVEAFFTFNSLGRFLKGYAYSAHAIVRSPLTAIEGMWNLAQDAFGYGKQATVGAAKGVMGDLRPYEPRSGIVKSFQTHGAAKTVGGFVHETVGALTGASLLKSLYVGDPEEIGRQIPGVLLGGTGYGVLNHGVPRILVARDAVDLSAVSRLNTIDRTGNGRRQAGEAGAAAELEHYLGGEIRRLEAADTRAGDFIFASGPHTGKTVDFMLTPNNLDRAASTNAYFQKNRAGFEATLEAHLLKSDYVPLDIRFLTKANQEVLLDIIQLFPPHLKKKIILMR